MRRMAELETRKIWTKSEKFNWSASKGLDSSCHSGGCTSVARSQLSGESSGRGLRASALGGRYEVVDGKGPCDLRLEPRKHRGAQPQGRGRRYGVNEESSAGTRGL